MIVKCISNTYRWPPIGQEIDRPPGASYHYDEYIADELTIGKLYETLYVGEFEFVKGDDNLNRHFVGSYRNLFIILEEYREEQLNKIFGGEL